MLGEHFIEHAEAFAKAAHRGQKRKYTGEPYRNFTAAHLNYLSHWRGEE